MGGLEWVGYLVGSNVAGIVAVIVLYFLRQHITALEKTVSTQTTSLQAQAQALQGLQNLLQAVEKFSGRWWAEQLEAYTKIKDQTQEVTIAAVRHEAETAVAEARRQVENEKREIGKSASEGVKLIMKEYGGLFGIVMDLMPYPPLRIRLAIVEKSKVWDDTKTKLLQLARSAPEPEPTLSQILAAMPASPGERLKDRMTAPLFLEHPGLPMEHPSLPIGRVPRPTLPGTKSESP